MERHHQRAKAGVGHHFGRRIVHFQSRVLRVDLGLRLGDGNARPEAGDHLNDIAPRVALAGRAIFGARGERKVQPGLRGKETEPGRQDADDGPGNAVHTDLPCR